MRKYIFDTDLGSDCDDCGALAILCDAVKDNRAELLAVTHCTSEIYGAYGSKAILDWFGVDCPVGQTSRKGFQDADAEKRYGYPMTEDYLIDHDEIDFPDAVAVLRKALADNCDVTMIFVGPLGNMEDLLRSGPDEISPLDGVSLVKQSVREVIVMGGDFGDFSHGEWNIYADIPAAQYMSENCPAPIVYCGFEAGRDIFTGATLWDCPERYPVRIGYWNFFGQKQGERNSWDLVTVYYALNPDGDWTLSEECAVRFDDGGRTLVSEGKGAKHVRHNDEAWLKTEMNRIIGLK
ncbi:MAG: nucleoside hydrolase [Clostridia bacterium]|nr:nucleoside hydrolase [Clostridia bacterium]